jgi:hypothetical protein
MSEETVDVKEHEEAILTVEKSYANCPLIREMILRRLAREWVRNACTVYYLIKKRAVPEDPIQAFIEETNWRIRFLGFSFHRDGKVVRTSDVHDVYVPYLRETIRLQNLALKTRQARNAKKVMSLFRLHIQSTLCTDHFPDPCAEDENEPTAPYDGLLDQAYTEFTVACPSCGKRADQTCGGCFLVMYCSAECQRAHRPTHKSACKAARLYSAVTNIRECEEFMKQHPEMMTEEAMTTLTKT